MTGIDLEKLAKSDPAVALATAIVKLINQAASLLRSFRTEKGLSQTEMANLLGLSQPRIAQLESGKPGNAPSLEQLAEYAFHAGKVLTVCDLSQLADMEEKHKALMRQTREYEAKLHKQEQQIQGHRDKIRALENAIGRLIVLGRTMREPRARHLASGRLRIGVRLKEIGTRLFASVLIRSSEDDFFRQYLTKLEVEELANSFQAFVYKDRTRVDTVLNAVSDVIQRHVGSVPAQR
jgi:transcriptional regulator with XRE-family HTH domain